MNAESQNWASKLERLHAAALTVTAAHNVEQALQTIVECARQIAAAELAALGVPGERGQPMRHFVTSGLSPEQHLPIGHPPVGRGVLSLLLDDGQGLRVPDVRDHPAYQGTPPAHPAIRSFLGVPILSDGQVLGDLYLANKLGAGEFSADDQRLVEMLAAHAAVVIQGLRARQQEHELAMLKEREEIARQLQDEVLQQMYGVGLLLGNIDLRHPDQASKQIADIRSLFGDTIERLRQHLLSLTRG